MAYRELSKHIVSGDSVNHQLKIEVLDEPGSGGANHKYDIVKGARHFVSVNFQDGPIAEAGVNGVTHEALLAILIDRMEGFQKGPYASPNNANALGHLDMALEALQRRTLERIARGVEGTHQK